MRRIAALAIATIATVGASLTALADDYPVRPITVIVPYSPGSGADIAARMTMAKLATFVKGNFIIEDRPGSSGITGTEAVAHARPDGYTLLWAPTQHAINAALYKTLPYDTLKDLIPIARVTTQPLFLGVSATVPANSVQELIAYAKARPGKLNYASTSVGGSIHLAGAWFTHQAGLQMSNVVYSRISQAMIDLARGEVQMIFYPYQPLLTDVNSGKARILGSTGANRSSWAPDIPTMAEAGVPDFVMPAWQGLFAPANTSTQIVAALEDGLRQVTDDPGYSRMLASNGTDAFYASSKGFDAFLRSEIERYQKLIATAGITPE